MQSHSPRSAIFDDDLDQGSFSDEDYLSEETYERRRLRIGHKMLSKFVEKPPERAWTLIQTGSVAEVLHFLADEETTDESMTQEANQKEVAELLGYDDIASTIISFDTRRNIHLPTEKFDNNIVPTLAPAEVKKPSRMLPPECVITRKDAFHAGAKIGTGSYLFYRGRDYYRAIRKKQPWPRSGKVAYMVDLIRNELRQIYKNVGRLSKKSEKLKREYELDLEYRRTKALLLIFMLEDNLQHLKTSLANYKLYHGLQKGNATIGIMGNIVCGKDRPNEHHPFFIERDAYYEREIGLIEALSRDDDLVHHMKSDLRYYELTPAYYEQWKQEHWREIRIRMNTCKGAGCITGQAIQGLVTAIINAGIAAGVNSPAAAAASCFYTLSTAARVIQTAIRTHLENNLIKHTDQPHDDNTILKKNSKPAVHKTHQHLDTLRKVEVVVNQIEGLGNSAFNITGTMTGMPLSTGKPATASPPIQSISAPVLSKSHSMFAEKKGQPVGPYRRYRR